MTRRVRPQIFAEILKAIIEDIRIEGEARITRVQTKVYVPYDRFKEYISVMRRTGLIDEDSLTVTEKGLKYLEGFKGVKEFLERFGLD